MVRHIKIDEEQATKLEQLNKDSLKEAIDFVIDEFFKGETYDTIQTLPCKNCEKCGNIIKNGKVLCLTKKTLDTSIKYQWIPIEIARACTEMPFNTPLNKKTREQYEKDLFNLGKNRDYYQQAVQNLRPKAERLPIVEKELSETKQQLENIQEPIKSLYADLQKISKWRLHLSNYTLHILNERKALETDNDFLRKQIEELSHDSLAEKNAFLKVELGKRDQDIEGLKSEIQKLEELNKWEHQKIINLTSETRKMLRDFNTYLPKSLEPYDISTYIKDVKKKIEQFESYLNTLLPSIS